MASSLTGLFDPSPLGLWMRALLRRSCGVVLLALALFFAASFFGFEPDDPSFNNATAGETVNFMGLAGSFTADLLYQSFGLAVWILPVAFGALGMRLTMSEGLVRPWLPAMALPLSLLLVSAWLASWPLGPQNSWPFRAGYGGFVGDLEFLTLQQHLSPTLFNWVTVLAGLAFAILSLGLGWQESMAAARRFGQHSARFGRQVGDVAVAASHASRDIIEDGMRRFDRRRPLRAAVLSEPIDLSDEPRPQRASVIIQHLKRAIRWFDRQDQDHFIEVHPDDDSFGDGFRTQRRSPVRGRRPASPRDVDAQENTLVYPPEHAAGYDDGLDVTDDEALSHSGLPEVASEAEREPRRDAPPAPRAPEVRIAARRTAPEPAHHPDPDGPFQLPTLDFLTMARQNFRSTITKTSLNETSRQLEKVLDDFGVRGEIIDAKPGPVVTMLELEPAPGTRSQRVISLADDIARSLCAMSVRVATVPGRNVIGIELPNPEREIVFLRDLLQSAPYNSSEARLPLALGKDISGETVIVDLARMPHLLIAGTTGSGKSVAINAMILSLLFRLDPKQCRIIMIDPKVIELSVYENIPHLLAPVVTEPHKAVVALKWVVRQMDERYRLMSHLGVRDIFAYNRRIDQARAKGQSLTRRVRVGFEPGTGQPIMEDQPIDMTPLPLIVVIVDEVADLMLTAGKEIESAIQRLSQKARAAGIHLIVATSRPSVDVLTGVIKANLPSRISFRVSSKIDSRTILGEPGAEQLLGQGDMLYLMPGDRIMRVHGALVSDTDVEKVVTWLRAQGEPEYDDAVTSENGGEPGADGGGGLEVSSEMGNDGVYNQAVQIVARDGKASTSYLQRKLSIGYNSAAKLIERMEAEGLISSADHVGRRQVLMGRGGIDGDQATDDL
ncbi:MAG: DNA translocase FtsK [Geminicoccaceae bacterium]|nr:DNA translocase FtsK [Geminicoccaceae bacterium]